MIADTVDRIKLALAGRYTIERQLGRGGMATVYLGHDLKHERDVAIKVLHPELAASIGSERFEREIRLAAKLQHPHILGLYDSGHAEGLLFYVMPFVNGESLRDRLDREGQLPIDDAIQIILEVTDALGHAHSQGIVHRDIKPENILLSNGHALVADFGIARAISEGRAQKLTQTGMALGTPVYMAPEQAMGEVVGPPADIYSMGCMLYEMLAGEPPFTGKSAQAILARHAMENVPSIRIVRSAVPEEVEDAIFSSMAKTPADRPQSAAKFAEFFGVPIGSTATRRASLRHTAGRRIPTLSGVPTMGAEPAAPPVWRRPRVLGLAALVLALGGGAAWYLLGRSPPASRGTPEASGPDPHRIAVLYFEDLSSKKDLGYATDGLTEAVIGALASVPNLKVISKAGVEPFRGTELSLDSIARTLDVGTIVRGTVEREGDKLRLGLRLTEASGSDFERKTLTLPAGNLLAARDSLAQEAANLIRRRLGEEIRTREQRESTKSVPAWSAYQRAELVRKQGEAALSRGDTAAMREKFAQADSQFASTEKLDPNWPDPIVARALIQYRAARQRAGDPVAVRKAIDSGVSQIDRALALNPTDPDALELRGNLRYFGWLLGLESDARKSEELLHLAQADLEQATNINPTQGGAWATLSHLYYQVGDKHLTDINIAAQRAYEADAFLGNADVVLNRLFLSSYDLENFTPNAERWCAEINRRFPSQYLAPQCQLYMLTTRAREPDVNRAWRLADSTVALSATPDSLQRRLSMNMLVAAVLARARVADSAARVVERALIDARRDPRIDPDPQRELEWWGAFAYTLLNNRTRAIDLLKVYLAANERQRYGFVANPSWWFRTIAQDPAFKQLGGN